jgi:hypothetical protein
MATSIVTVNVSLQPAPLPSTLQQTGAFISQGGTTTTLNTLTPITQMSDLTAILAASKALSALAWSGGTVTATTSVAHGWNVGDTVQAVIAGVAPAGYNGAYAITITSTTQFTFALAANPGTVTTEGTVTLYDESELLSMATTYFGQGNQQAAYVLELGEGTPAEGVTALSSWITANPSTVYAYLVPREWDGVASFIAFMAGFNANTSKTYFVVTTTTGTYTQYAAPTKCLLLQVEAPGRPSTEFSAAATFYNMLSLNPSTVNKVTQLAFTFLYGVTAWAANSTILPTLKNANVNYVGTGSEGGLANTILFWGRLFDGNTFNYWYSIDWVQIQSKQALAAAVIQGSNNILAPLDYDQPGVNVLQNVVVGIYKQGVSFGLATGTVTTTQLPQAQFAANYQAGKYAGQLVVNADPFSSYITEQPANYQAGVYGGLSGTWTPTQGFQQIIFNVDVVPLT